MCGLTVGAPLLGSGPIGCSRGMAFWGRGNTGVSRPLPWPQMKLIHGCVYQCLTGLQQGHPKMVVKRKGKPPLKYGSLLVSAVHLAQMHDWKRPRLRKPLLYIQYIYMSIFGFPHFSLQACIRSSEFK